MRTKLIVRVFSAVACAGVFLFATSCSQSYGNGGGSTPPVTTLSEISVQTGGTTSTMGDPTAITTIALANGSPNYSTCYATGTLGLPAGECQFGSPWGPGSWWFDFLSGDCAVAGQNAEVSGYMIADANGNVPPVNVCTVPEYAAPSAGTHFSIVGSFPSSVTVSAPSLTTTYGMPQLLVYDSSVNYITSVTATSVAVDGSNATFPFPTSLSQGTYMFAVKNLGASGTFKVVDATYYSVGGNPTLSAAFGVDAADTSYSLYLCISHAGCYTSGSSPVYPIVTQYNSGQVTYYKPNTTGCPAGQLTRTTVSVGTRPVAVKLYNSYTAPGSCSIPGQSATWSTVFPSKAVVVNSGSNNVSLVDFMTSSSTSVAVGTQPMALALDSTATKAYVANYGSNSLSEVNLSTQTVSRTSAGLTGAQSVAVDPSGSFVWVGGTTSLYKVSLSTFAVVGTYSMGGTVTSLATSNAQNELVYTLVQNCCTGSSTYSANELKLATMTSPGAYASASASPYAPYTMNGTLPSAASLPQATTVSAKFGNGLAASSTPTGFVLYDIVSHKQILAGTTPTPVRGIASDPLNKVVYFTVPDSNEYVVVPVPYQ